MRLLFLVLLTAATVAAQSAPANQIRAEPSPEAAAGLSVAALLGLICLGVAALLVAFLPVAIAMYRGHPNTAPILLVCLLAGWTGIGWIVALVWSFTAFEVSLDSPRRSRRR